MSEFGERLNEALTLAEKDRKDLAKHLSISVQAVGQVIRGDAGAFNAINTAKAARFLGVNWYWLATGDESPNLTEGVKLNEDERNLLHKLSQAVAPAPPPPPTDSTIAKVTGNRLLERIPARKPKQKHKGAA